ncbi:nucleoside hydrolase-like domain-containing protein [Pectobacterium brasiliense]|uniref:nucleoside hydrolase-like domain-containing protein n=1 Tax=Pectobacterium brasiliense TaxID=180957 RepID=UPI00387EDE25
MNIPKGIIRAPLMLLALVSMLLLPALGQAAEAVPEKTRILILTDIGNEPDDSQSLVRFLLYSNEFDVEGIVATTSTWLRDKVNPEMIMQRLDAYEKVLPNLRRLPVCGGIASGCQIWPCRIWHGRRG